MKCNSCKILISSAFSYSIMSNVCPACGQSIMDEEKSSMLSYILQTMSSQSFSEKVESSLLNEISMFIFSEFIDVDDEDGFEESDSSIISDSPAEDQQFDDVSSSINYNETLQDEDLDDKAARLVEKYRADQKVLSSGKKTGVSVRRVTT
jgi:hypothetical protein